MAIYEVTGLLGMEGMEITVVAENESQALEIARPLAVLNLNADVFGEEGILPGAWERAKSLVAVRRKQLKED